MNIRTVELIDKSRTVVATAKVTDEGTHFGGTIDLQLTPPELRSMFDEFEEVVNGQMFSFVDEIQSKIGLYAIKAIFDDGFEVNVSDLQVFPSAGDVSFKLVGTPALAKR